MRPEYNIQKLGLMKKLRNDNVLARKCKLAMRVILGNPVTFRAATLTTGVVTLFKSSGKHDLTATEAYRANYLLP